MHKSLRVVVATVAFTAAAAAAGAQGMPTSQPGILSIFIEDVKPGKEADHMANEAGWPAAFARAGSEFYYMALSSMTGTTQVWYLSPYESWTQEGENMKRNDENPELSAELARLWRADAQYLNSARAVQAVARPDLSYGTFPNLGLVRFYEITTFRVRPGHEQAWEAAAGAYIEAAKRSTPNMSFRTYSVVAGMPGSTYLILSSANSYGEFDQMMADGMAMWESATEQEMGTLENAMRNDVSSVITHRFRVSPSMSYVAPEARAADPEFWNAKR